MIATALCLALLWFRLIDHLRVEWSVNPQYAYGWAVPVLCIVLLWRRRGARGERREGRGPVSSLPSSLWSLPLAATALAYGATRLVAEANPDWRLVSWAMALEVIVITLWLLRFSISAFQRFSISHPLPSPLLPLLFFLVAVPWPTFIETPLVQVLSRANAASAVEVLGWFGVPALQHGNVIEVGNGIVGIDDACSGIRSLQATLMIALFFGEFYRLVAWRRVSCVAAGFILSFLFNVVRTTVLTGIAGRQGISAIERWHDPAGVAILLGCFLMVWVLARGGREKREESREDAASLLSAFQPFSVSAFVLAFLVAVEFGVAYWYRSHESNLPTPVAWRIEIPRDKADFREMPLSERTSRFLRYDEGINARWNDEGRWQAIFLHWNPGRIAARAALGHTPETCLCAAGRQLVSSSEPRLLYVGGMPFPVRFYTFTGEDGLVHVLYCLRQEHTYELVAESLTWRSRLAAVKAGIRNTGQRSLELALWSEADDPQAYATLEREFLRLVRVNGDRKTPDERQKHFGGRKMKENGE